MTREQNFRTTFITQFTTYSSIPNIPHKEIRKLPVPLFPSFSLGLGKTKYTLFDPLGKAISGEQEFSVTVFYALRIYSAENAYLEHSDITNILEQFINDSVYLPPVILPGDTYCIERTVLTDAQAPVIAIDQTRYSVGINAKYIFTIF